MAMATRSYQSIGEVLVALKAEFPDVTISKIRFLEGEGLIEPERTPSGYRKFYETDVDRLRKILRMQRDEYLPLKVIKERLVRESQDVADGIEPGTPQEKTAPEDEIVEAPTGLQMSVEELAAATGVDRDRIRDLAQYGILCEHGQTEDKYFDGDDFIVLTIVKDFFRFGVEPRHLTMYRHFAEREASFFEAIIMPVLRQKNPDARRTAANTLGELTKVSRKLKQALLRNNLRQYLTSSGS